MLPLRGENDPSNTAEPMVKASAPACRRVGDLLSGRHTAGNDQITRRCHGAPR